MKWIGPKTKTVHGCGTISQMGIGYQNLPACCVTSIKRWGEQFWVSDFLSAFFQNSMYPDFFSRIPLRYYTMYLKSWSGISGGIFVTKMCILLLWQKVFYVFFNKTYFLIRSNISKYGINNLESNSSKFKGKAKHLS